MIRLSPNKTGDHENIFGALGFVGSRATSPLLAALRPISPQAIDLQEIYILPTRHHLASLSRSGVFRGRTRTRSWPTETYNSRKASCGRRRDPRTGCATSSKPDPRLVNLVRLLARQAARDFVRAETDGRKRDRLPE